MYAGADWDPIEPAEVDFLWFDFTQELGPAETILSAQWMSSVIKTVSGATADASPSSRLLDTATIISSLKPQSISQELFVRQKVGGMVPGNQYLMLSTIVTSAGRTLSLHSHVTCLSPS